MWRDYILYENKSEQTDEARRKSNGIFKLNGGVSMNPLPNLQSPTVLLFRSDEKQIRLRRRELEAEGYRVVCTHSGREAFETFERERIDAVVVDFMLPDMHVLDLIDGIAEKRSQTPIVINSPYAAC